MTLPDEDWNDLFEHMRTRVREVGLSEIDQRIARDFRGTERRSKDFLLYLDQFLQAISESSASTYRRSLDRFRQYLETEDGSEIEGIEVAMIESDSLLYSVDSLDLGEQTDNEPIVRELKRLRSDMEEAGLFDEQEDD